MLEKSPKSKYSAVFSCIHSSNHSSITVLKQQKNPTRLAGSSFLVIFTAVPWLTNNKIQSHIPSYMLEKVQIGCPLHPHLSLSVMSLGFMLVYLPLTHLVLSQLGSKSCSYLLLTETQSFLFLPSPSMASVLVWFGYQPNAGSEDSSQLAPHFLPRAAISSNILLKSFVIP